MFVASTLAAIAVWPALGQGQAELHILYNIYSPVYLNLVSRPDWQKATGQYLKHQWQVVGQDPGAALLFNLGEPAPGRKKAVSPERIVAVARFCEEAGIRFWLAFAGAGPLPALRPETCQEVVRAAPRQLQGFFISEAFNCGALLWWPETARRVIEIADGAGKKVVWQEHGRDGPRGVGWFGLAAYNLDLWQRLLAPEFSDTVVMLHETNDPRGETINMGVCLGAWLGGVVQQWGFSVQDWYWNDAGYGTIADCPPDLVLRMCLMAVSLGGTYVEFEHPQMLQRWGTWAPAPIYLRGIRPFLSLYRDGKLPIPSRGDLLSVSPVALRLRPTSGPYTLFESAPWQPEAPRSFLPRAFYGHRVARDGLIPTTPRGVLAVLPPGAEPVEGAGIEKILPTDCKGVWVGGRKLVGEAAARQVAAMAEGADIFRSADAYVSAVQVGEDEAVVYVIDPNEKAAGDVEAEVIVPQGWEGSSVRDAMTGSVVQMASGTIRVTVPSGGFRLLRVKRR